MMECMKSMAKKPQTNADRIRSMTDEELKEWIKAERPKRLLCVGWIR